MDETTQGGFAPVPWPKRREADGRASQTVGIRLTREQRAAIYALAGRATAACGGAVKFGLSDVVLSALAHAGVIPAPEADAEREAR